MSVLAKQAAYLGYSGIVAIEQWHGAGSLDTLKKVAAGIETAELEIFTGAELQPKNTSELIEALEKAKPEADMIIVSGADPATNLAACNDPRVNLLLPNLERPDGGLDYSCFEAAARNGVAIGLCFRNALVTFRKQRANLLVRLADVVRSAQAARAQLVLVSGATSVWEMRDPRELIGLANILGMELPNAFAAMSDNPLHIIERKHDIAKPTQGGINP